MTRNRIRAALSALRAGDATQIAGWRVEAYRGATGRREFRAMQGGHGDPLPRARVIVGPRAYVINALASRVGEVLERAPRARRGAAR